MSAGSEPSGWMEWFDVLQKNQYVYHRKDDDAVANLLIGVVFYSLYEAAAYGSCFSTPGAPYYKCSTVLPVTEGWHAEQIFQHFVELLEWMYAPESVEMSLAWICEVLSEEHYRWNDGYSHAPEKLYRPIVERLEALLAWRDLTPEERRDMRWRISERYNIFINEWLEL